jgi:hypothetical protein
MAIVTLACILIGFAIAQPVIRALRAVNII